ncbi:MAG: hypothetical protein R3F19_20885 [Verrucomicrobiales bacterium]
MSASRPQNLISDAGYPAGTRNAYGFAAFNALSFQMVLGSPMILYAKSLGASATVLGLIAGMLPLLVALQIPAAGYVDKAGYKKFVEINSYSILFSIMAAAFVTRSLEEPEADDLEVMVGEAMGNSRIRFWLRFWFRSTPRG